MQIRQKGKNPFENYLDYMKALSNNPNLRVNEEMAQGEYSFEPSPGEPNNNRKLLRELQRHGNLQSNADDVLKAYCRACAIMVTTEDMARVRSKFHDGTDAATGKSLIPMKDAQHTARSMGVSGLYDEAGRAFVEFGALTKSDVDGGMMGSLPSKVKGEPDLIFATHHAELNMKGNSIESDKWIKSLSRIALVFPDEVTLPGTKGLERKVTQAANWKSDSVAAGGARNRARVTTEFIS